MDARSLLDEKVTSVLCSDEHGLCLGTQGPIDGARTAGLFHSMAVTEAGALYSWGSGTNGRLGHGDTVMTLRPRPVEALARADSVGASAGSGHSVAVSASGRLFSWGQS